MDGSGRLDLVDIRRTENTRAFYPIEAIPDYVFQGMVSDAVRAAATASPSEAPR